MNQASELARLWIADGRADLPLPGAGDTVTRWRTLMAMARENIPAARLVEAHADAAAICTELELAGRPGPDSLWAVWAAEPPSPVVTAEHTDQGWRLDGTKAWCSAAGTATHALITARSGGSPRLFQVDLSHPGVSQGPQQWAAAGMSQTDTGTVHFDAVPAVPAGEPSSYLQRPGFWHGGIGVACCWWGGAQGLIDLLQQKLGHRENPHALAHLGACLSWDMTITAALTTAAADIDAAGEDIAAAHRRALGLRTLIDRACTDVIQRFGRALGPGPMAQDMATAQRVQDLQVYIRQSHADTDEAELARLTLQQRASE